MTSLVHYDAMRAALARAHKVPELLHIKNQTDQLIAAARVANDREAASVLTEIQIRAERLLGELIAKQQKRGPQHSRGGGSKGSKREPLLDAPPTLAQLGIDKKLSARAQKLAGVPEKQFEAAVAVVRQVVAEVTADKVLKHKNGRHNSKMADSETPVVIPAARAKSDEAHISGLFDALELLASFPIPAEDVYAKVRHYQRHRVSNHLQPSIEFLTALRAHWGNA